MADVMQGIEEDVPFDNGTADALISACDGAATSIEGQAASRTAWENTAMTEFKGHFSELFTANASVAAGDATELAARLREVATGARKLKEEARKEQERRETARQWKQEQDDRNLWDKGVDWAFGGDDPPVGPAAAEPSIEASAPVNGTRETPAPGAGGSGGGTSSAKPADLRTFATGSQGANDELRSKPTGLRSKMTDFTARCKWGRLEASGVFTGFDKWMEANDQDVQWATLVADAFAAAGGEGNVSTVADSALLATLQAAGVDASRTDIVIDPPTAYGSPPTTGYANDPVNTATGNFIEVELDLGFGPGTAGLSLGRTYNSFDDHSGAFGPGWSSPSDVRIDVDDEAARLVLADGRQITFPRLATGWDRASGENLWLERTSYDGADRLVVTGNDCSRWEFTATGTWLTHSTGPGTTIAASRDELGRLVRISHERGRHVELTWSGDRVVEAHASDGRRLVYGYDAAGRLTSALGPLGTRTYRWSSQGLIDAVIDPDGVVEAENTYDAQRRVVSQRSPHGRITRFAYLPGQVTVVSDADGTRSNTWIHDRRGRLIGVVDAHDHRQSSSYDNHGNLVLVTERDGASTVHSHDLRGRRVRTVTPSGADISYGYDDHDRVTTVVTEQGAVTTYEYDDQPDAPLSRNPSVLIDPEGGRTELTWRHGLLTRVVDPVGVVVSFEHDEHGELIATTDAEGNAARIERDPSGQVVAAITPSGARTTFEYDTRGLLASRRDADGAVWTYEHTTAGRLSAVIDPTGARTETERGAHGETVRTVDPLGRAVTRSFDDLGNVASTQLPDGSSWHFVHDAMSRLAETVDPTGASWRREYGPTGDLVAITAPDGTRQSVTTDRAGGTARMDDGVATTGVRVDPLGRPVSVENADGSAALTTFDRCGRPVEIVDAEGGLTVLRRDAAGRVTSVVQPSGATRSLEYDRCGRLSAEIDPLGARTTLEHDTDGRVVRRISPTGDISRVEYDAVGRVVARHEPGRGSARYAYDAAGRLTRSSDTWLGKRRFRYDAAGQLVAVVNGNGGTTHFGYDANGRVVTITDPLGGVTRREYDAMNRVVAETDPLGRTTRAGYDANGRATWQQDPTGRRTSWGHDASGRLTSVAVDGDEVSTFERDLRNRTITVRDRTRGDGQESEHRLAWNARGQLVSRSRDGRGISWEYDADGLRTAVVGPDGSRTTYDHDAAGRVVAVDHPLLGRAVLEHDAAGRLVQATAGGVIQTWSQRDGFVVAHTVVDAEASSRTEVDRDEVGRIQRVTRDGRTTTFGYDEACQLIESRLEGSVARWQYDEAGRLVAESHDATTRTHVHDAAGQVLSTTVSGPDATTRTDYEYDGVGRRTTQTNSDGSRRDYEWSRTGWLAGVVDHVGDTVRRTSLHVDATGELASVDGAEMFWDTADRYAPSLLQTGDVPVVNAGAFTGIGDSWSAPGWRTARSGNDPWTASAAAEVAGGLSIGAAGELSIAGLEWMGARTYDPTTRGFLSVDPLDPVAGAGWAGNPYSFAGNDPLHALDPTGFRPVTDAELKAYAASNNGAASAVGDWVGDNWEYLAGGAMVIAGGVLIATGVGGPAGMMLVSAGADTIIQKATTGGVNWGQVAISGAFGAFGGTGLARTLGANTLLKQRVVGGMISGTASGATGGAYSYATGPGPHTPGGLLQATLISGGTGLVTGGAGGAFQHGVDTAAMRYLPRTQVVPETSVSQQARDLLGNPGDTVVLGRQVDTAVANGWDGHTVLDTDNWTRELNDEWVQGAIDYQRPVYTASPLDGNMVQTSGPYAGEPTIYARELDMIQEAGYTPSGDDFLPPR